MDIPNNNNSDSNVPRIRNLHPSQLSPEHPYGAINEDHIPIERTMSSFSERLGSFVGSYSRTSMMFMAENLAVPNGPLVSVCLAMAVCARLVTPCVYSLTTKKTSILRSRRVMFQESHQKPLCHGCPESNQAQVQALPMNILPCCFRIWTRFCRLEASAPWLMTIVSKHILLQLKSRRSLSLFSTLSTS